MRGRNNKPFFKEKTQDNNILNKLININDEKDIVVYTDGSCTHGKGIKPKAGVGVYFGDNDPRNYSGPLEGEEQTNNRAEIMAAIIALKRTDKSSNVKIVTDSIYLKNSITVWINQWKKNGWRNKKNKKICNKDLFMILDKEIEKRKSMKSTVTWEWIKGHGDCRGNIEADKLAKLGVNKH